MQFFYYLAAFLLINRLGKSLKYTPLALKWKTMISYGQWGVLIVGIMCSVYVGDWDWAKDILGSGVLLGIVLFIDREADFKHFKSYSFAHYPLIAVGFITGLTELIAEDFYEKHDEYFVVATVAAFIWIFGRWATSKKQQEEIRIVGARNAELDMLVAQRTQELTNQKNELEKTVSLLQTTQEQLIQSEKLASLGELTAGIAHEIQNPLNFVNNFSEVSVELLDEMEQELNDGNMEEVIAIANDIKQNLEKIRHHGQRADNIVKSMLQHSRASTGQKEPADINALADEYFRLSYHGLRAKDKSFNAELVTDFNATLPKVNVLQQDLGRVLLNLYNNAFYAVQQKQKTSGNDYKPMVKVSTAVVNKSLQIKVEDNGIGIPDAVKDKILQPFFTTKPTGEGTGLGLSLSYDIVAKGHGGKIDIDSKEGEYTKFTVILPIS
ncbi:sensor histidine kinase [Mucilaginibacter sp. X5P1]|uniref:sensor histidine kinase n=1 Tax=Mucilaginibacter sp. X5P1 TaxID=2723088 RepID=UPI0016192584|nr:ATP-binding protein [Mucilaginibacter sp. X5P1]MBB6137825.1 signal transduction histidine kinase [Mucilaginibacter sp. X5P1]